MRVQLAELKLHRNGGETIALYDLDHPALYDLDILSQNTQYL